MNWDTTLFSLADSNYHVIVDFLLQATSCPGLSSAELVAFQTDYAGTAFLCPIKGCQRSYVGYPSAAELNDHKTRRHSQRLRCYQGKCVYNDVGFANEGSLRQHVQKVHKKPTPRIPAGLKRKRVTEEPKFVWTDPPESQSVDSETERSGQSASNSGPENTPSQPQSQSQVQPQRPGEMAIQIQKHLEAMSWIPPPDVVQQGPEVAAKWSANHKEKYKRAMLQMQSTTDRLKSNESLSKTLKQKGAAITPEEQKSLQTIESQKPQIIKAYQDAKRFIERFRKGQAERRTDSQATDG